MSRATDDLSARRADLELWGRTVAEAAPLMASEHTSALDLDGRRIPTLTLTPSTCSSEVPHVFLHGGAWCMGSSRAFTGLLRRMADQCQRPVVSIDYPLSPEHPFPAAIDATMAALVALQKESGIAGLIGGSAGCHVALAAMLGLRGSGFRHGPRALLLWNPALAQRSDSWTHAAFGAGHGLTSAVMDEAYDFYAVPKEDPLHDMAASDLSGLPPTWIACGDRDPLLDDSLRAFARLISDGGEAHLSVAPGAVHGFMNNWFDDARANAAVTQALDWLESQCTLTKGVFADAKTTKPKETHP